MAISLRSDVLLRASQTAEELSVIEMTVGAGWGGPPLHHHDFDEAFYVLRGELTFQLGDEVSTRGPGTLTFAPRGSHHTLANLSEAEASYLLICTPAGFERRFDRRAAEEAGIEPDAEALKPIPPTTVVGPQIGAREAVGCAP